MAQIRLTSTALWMAGFVVGWLPPPLFLGCVAPVTPMDIFAHI